MPLIAHANVWCHACYHRSHRLFCLRVVACLCRAFAVPPGMASLASELGGSSILEVEMSQSPNMLADEGDAQAAQHNGNGLAPALLLSNGGGGQAAAASVTDPQQPPEGQQAPQQQDQAEQQAVSSAVSGSSVQLSAPTSVRGCCCALRAFWTDFQVRLHFDAVCILMVVNMLCSQVSPTGGWAEHFADVSPEGGIWAHLESCSGVTQPGVESPCPTAHMTAPTRPSCGK